MMTLILLCALPALVLLLTLFNVATWRRGDPRHRSKSTVSVLIPARNEERTIEQAVRSVLDQASSSLVSEVLVYDDKSTDATRRIVARLGLDDGRVHTLSGVPLPDGWVGKPHACANLADAARGDVFLFMDADVTLKPGGLKRLLSLHESGPKGKVITAVPEQETVSFFERLVVPLLVMTYTSWLPLRAVEWGRDPKTVAANGQLLLVGREAYRRIGGFEAVRRDIVDDVAFCRTAKKKGEKVVFADGSLMASCRMYNGPKETVEGFSKNLHEGVGGTLGLAFVALLYVSAYLLPYLGFTVALLVEPLRDELLVPSAFGISLNLILRAALAVRYRQPWEGVLLHPASIVAFLYIAFNSWRWYRRGAIRWAGRTYDQRAKRFSEGPNSRISQHQLSGEPS